MQQEQRKGLEQQHPSPIPYNKTSNHRLLQLRAVGAPGAPASGSLPAQAPAGCRGRLAVPLVITIYQKQHMVQQQQQQILRVKSESSHRLSGAFLWDGAGQNKGTKQSIY